MSDHVMVSPWLAGMMGKAPPKVPVAPTQTVAAVVADTWDVVEFFRSAMFTGAKRSDGFEQSDVERVESGDRVSTGAKPASRPPFDLGAMEAADVEVAALVRWAESVGLAYVGQVWRVGGVPRGLLYGDVRPVRSLVVSFGAAFGAGWVAPQLMVDELCAVRLESRRLWPELDVLLSRGRCFDDEVVVSDGQGSFDFE